jgi:hypothetical protein
MQRDRDYLKQVFKDGERPSGADFEDLMDSFLNKATDGLTVDDNSNLELSHGIKLGNSVDNVTEGAGTLRFDGSKVQFHNGTVWVDLGGGAFQSRGDDGAVVYEAGNVGIGTFTSPPIYRLHVQLAADSAEPKDRVRFGNAVCSNGQGDFDSYACFYHFNHAPPRNHALGQGPSGNVHLNAPRKQPITIRQNGSTICLAISDTGHVIIANRDTDLEHNQTPVTAALQVDGDAYKNTGENWSTTSDARLKEDIRDLEAGLQQLLRVRPVRFRYNGKAGTPAGREGVGIIGQEIEQIFPEMVQRVPHNHIDGLNGDDLLVYNGSALTYVLVNAVKELANKVEKLETALAEAKKGQ